MRKTQTSFHRPFRTASRRNSVRGAPVLPHFLFHKVDSVIRGLIPYNYRTILEILCVKLMIKFFFFFFGGIKWCRCAAGRFILTPCPYAPIKCGAGAHHWSIILTPCPYAPIKCGAGARRAGSVKRLAVAMKDELALVARPTSPDDNSSPSRSTPTCCLQMNGQSPPLLRTTL